MNVILDDISFLTSSEAQPPAASGAFGKLYLENNRVLWRIEATGNTVIDIAAIREAISAINMITQNRKTPLMIDLSDQQGIPTFTPTAKAALMGNDFLKLRSAIAFVTSEITRRTIFMHLVSYNKANIPMKSFSNEVEAGSWLQAFIAN